MSITIKVVLAVIGGIERLGRGLIAINDYELAAEAMGINPTKN